MTSTERPPMPGRSEEPASGVRLRVLVVDDDFHVAHAHALSVDRVAGFTVVAEAHSRREAEQVIAEHDPELVLLDMYLPDGSGLDVMRAIAGTDDPPDVIAVTAARDIDTVRTALQLGAFYYLVKPFPVAALHEQLTAYRLWHQRLAGITRADQSLVDELITARSSSPRKTARPAVLPPTMAKVLSIVTTSPHPLGATEVADQLGASRPTAQRYLAVLLRRRLIDLDLAYGSTGRPEHRYRAR